MFEEPDRPRDAYSRLFSGLKSLRPATFAARSALVDRAYLTQGITFAHGGREQPFPFDLLPRLIPADEWTQLDAGLAQRVRRPRPLHRRHLRPAPRRGRRCGPQRARHHLRGLRPRDGRHRAAARPLRPRRRDRPGARRRRHLARPRGQSALPVGALLRRAEPGVHAPRVPRGLRRPPRRAGRPRPVPAAVGADGRRPRGARLPARRGADARPGQPGLLRARVPGAADGRAAGRGARPDDPRPPRLPAHHHRARAGGRHLPPHRRRLPRPREPQGRLAPGRGGPDAVVPRGAGRHLQRGRHRRGRRQGRLRLRPGPDPLLPRRGADPRAGPDLPAWSARTSAPTRSPTSIAWW